MLSDFEKKDGDEDCESAYDNSEIIDGKRKTIQRSENTENGYCNLCLPLTFLDEILHQTMAHLPIESYNTCALVHPSWDSFTTDATQFIPNNVPKMLPKSNPGKGVKSTTLENIQKYDYTTADGWGYMHYELCINYKNVERYIDRGSLGCNN